MEKNILLAFVSPVLVRSLNSPIHYPDIHGRAYTAIQTNESAIVFVERMLAAKENSLSKIFLIASDSVQTDKAPSENEFGDVTHLEFLMRRVVKECPQLADSFSIQDYSEEGDVSTALEKNILQTAKIADAVMKFAQENFDDKIKVHADMTGGFRHASMLMLSIIQLLKYRGVQIGEILYSDPKAGVVYAVTEIQRMFSLITGADEFVKFGSVEALQEYFGENPPQAAKSLLEAMNRFSEAIKICRTSTIEIELANLDRHIQTFREHPDKDLKSSLFAKIIDTVEREYGKLISAKTSRAEIIRWCMKKGFWQQAMTLCTEWLPKELVEREICKPQVEFVRRTCESRGRSAHKTWQQYFVIDYKVADKVPENKTFFAALRQAVISADAESFPELKTFFDEYAAARQTFERCRHKEASVNVFKKNFPTIVAILQLIFDERKTNPSYKRNFYGFLQTVPYAQIPTLMINFSNETLAELFKINLEQNTVPAVKSENQWERREAEYRELLRQKLIRLRPDTETALKFLKGYYEIRHERNQVNHAATNSTKTIHDLRKMIDDYLTALEKISVS